ncbi:cytochrome c biogenesis protein CcsA [Sporomusa sp. KB1]|jgi:cytochrome c-type biogenesis protein CcmF|uniref:cytochrome c biogenesis protein CcsA n=1 Tax=Sporomusa sp. KB1 TaxID=943346 RepID=UPI0011AC9287|nr:cytochrome c biogenesis protein CcsA [Sporomusa sp. KB1]TWH48047.1 cytochrome c-type biogenesis protein CcmF [Sporomusa sp. KB1]
MIGYGAVLLALVVTMFAVGCYWSSGSNPIRAKHLASTARFLYSVSAGLVGVAAGYLLYLILGDRFDYAYVFSYSSRELALGYKVAAFWAGQEGSFMLWLVFHAVFGMVLLQKPAAPMPVMTVYALIQAVLLGLLLVKSPFMMLAEPRVDGVGLNPLLQDMWMAIHPPVLFLGYAALAVPFAYALGSMWANRHQDWLKPAAVWTLFALSSLGTGMFLGGFWAYKVLGWGGYWAWDPVENSSLVPWLAAGAVIHLLAIARVRVGAIKQAYAGVIASFILVLYGTFLTRSGVLSDFSTHSFTDEGIGGLLGLTVLVATFVAFVLYIVKWPSMPSGELYSRLSGREFMLALTALVLAFLGALVFVGMSTPLVSMALGSAQSVSSAFYNQATLPLAVAIGAALIAGPLSKWGGSCGGLGKEYWWLGLFLLGGLGVSMWLKLMQSLAAIALCLAVTAAVANGYAAWKRTLSWAAACSHIGIAFLLAGIMASGAASQSVVVTFNKGQIQTVFGQQISYEGTELEPAGKDSYNMFHIGPDKTIVQALTKLNKAGMPAAREPAIYRSLLADIYIAPIEKEAEVSPELTLIKDQPLAQEDVSLTFVKFSMAGMDGSAAVKVQTVIAVTVGGQTQEVRPELTNQNGHIVGSTVTAFDRYQLHITGLRPGEGQVTIEFNDKKVSAVRPVRLEAEISYKPLINLVWLGAFLITMGTGWAGAKKLLCHRQVQQRGQNPDVRTTSRTR